MNKRDEKIVNCDFDYWIIFIYISDNNVTRIALFENDGKWFPYVTDDAMSFDAVTEKIEKELGITSDDCFKSRYISSSTDVNYKESPELNAWASYIRLKDKVFLNPSVEKYKHFSWFTKEEARKKLEEKPLQVAFQRVFTEDTFWESLDTGHF